LKIKKAVITAAAPYQRTLPLQTLVDRDGVARSVLGIIIAEAVRAQIEEICVVVCPGDEMTYREAAGDHAADLRFIAQAEPRGYGQAVMCASDFVGGAPFLHMVGDHLYISASETGCAAQLVEVAAAHACAVSAVQSTREHLLPYFGAIGGRRVKGMPGLYEIERVLEKPTPTEAEQMLATPGLRSGHYLCFFGMHVLTPTVIDLLRERLDTETGCKSNLPLSPLLAELADRERYLALETRGRRYPVDGRYGMLTAQLALALSGNDRDEVLANLCELLAQRELGRGDR
jgi:UTP--glucose-1-phosphate uridylyltransferase